MAVGKTLTVLVSADVSQLTSGLGKGRASLRDFANGTASLGDVMKANLGPALLGAAAAAGAFAVALAVDGVKAALEDEKAVQKLAKTLQNTGFASAQGEVENFITSLQMANGVSDTILRPSLERLLIATNDLGTAQSSLKLALDISAGTGKNLEQVSNALGKAYEGNYGALSKLGVGLDKTIIKSGDMSLITKSLSQTFEGQAKTAAETYQGKLNRISEAADEAKEAIGYALLGAVDRISGSMGGADGATSLITDFGDATAGLVTGVGLLAEQIAKLPGLFDRQSGSTDKAAQATDNLFIKMLSFGKTLPGNFYYPLTLVGMAANEAAEATNNLSTAIAGVPTIDWLTNYGTGLGVINDKTRRQIQLDENLAKAQAIIDAQKKKITTTTKGQSTATSELSKEMEREKNILMDLYDTQVEMFNGAKNALDAATSSLDEWNSKIQSFTSDLQSNILSGTDIGSALDEAGSDAAKAAGLSTADIFTKKLEKSIDFGRTLKELQASGAKDNLIQQVASIGPEAGLSLAKELIDRGLVPGLQSKLDQAEAAAYTVAQSLVPPFLTAGRDAAQNTVLGAIDEFKKQTFLLQEIGAQVGKTLGDAAAEEIVKALNAAYKALGTGQVASSIATGQNFTAFPGGSGLSAQEANMFDIAAYNANYAAALLNTGSDIDRVVRQSNNRNGWYEMPVVSPVLQ